MYNCMMAYWPKYSATIRTKLEIWFHVDATKAEPGFIKALPYLLLLRWLIVLGISLRFRLHYTEYDGLRLFFVYELTGLAFLIAVVATYVTYKPILRTRKSVQLSFIVVDILLFSVLYVLTQEFESDFYLFYYLPLFTATEYFGKRVLLIVFSAITVAFVVVLLCMYFYYLDVPLPPFFVYFSSVFLGREVLFLGTGVLSFYLRNMERAQKQQLVQRQTEIENLLKFATELAQVFDLQQALRHAAQNAANIPGMVGSHITLIDYSASLPHLQVHLPQHGYLRHQNLEPLLQYEARLLHKNQDSLHHRLADTPDLAACFSTKVQSLLYIPITTHNTSIGLICVGAASRHDLNKTVEQYLLGMAGLLAIAVERARLLTALREISAASAGVLDLDRELNSLLMELTETYGGDFASISLVDEYRRTVEMVRGKNVPWGWLSRSKYTFDDNDILVDVVKTGKLELVTGWDKRFNPEIYERFRHKELARIFAPLVASDQIIGVIEVGAHISRAEKLTDPQNALAIKHMGNEHGVNIARARPHILLELIARHAITILSADSASIHIYRADQLLLQAGAGKATHEFLFQFPPRPDGIGRQAFTSNIPVILDTPQALAEKHPILYNSGVRALGAFPLTISNDTKGILYVHFWREHCFTAGELELISVFALQIGVAIQNHLLLNRMAEGVERALTLSSFQNIIQLLASGSSLKVVLKEIVHHILYILDADNITLHQYDEQTAHFEPEPIMVGSFRYPATLQHPLSADAVAWLDIRSDNSRFIDDVSRDQNLRASSNAHKGIPSFIMREEIVSTAVLVLRTRSGGERVGLMYVNYRQPHAFDIENQNIINALAASVAIAIRTARLYEQLGQDMSVAAATLQHRLGNTVDIIMPAVGRLRQRAGADPVWHETLDLIERNAGIATSAIRAMSRRLPYENFASANLNELLQQAITNSTKNQAHPTSQIHFRYLHRWSDVEESMHSAATAVRQIMIIDDLNLANPPMVYVSIRQMTEVFQILIENAIRAICDKPITYPGCIELRSYIYKGGDRHMYEIQVSDNGCGIEEPIRSYLFKQPAPRQNLREGTGLGLWLSGIIVRRHQGEIYLKETGVGIGSTFIIRIPVYEP